MDRLTKHLNNREWYQAAALAVELAGVMTSVVLYAVMRMRDDHNVH